GGRDGAERREGDRRERLGSREDFWGS
ncbi:MAG: hypothetical protein A07HB70_01909, partial [uncultured archaeon A07HB70]